MQCDVAVKLSQQYCAGAAQDDPADSSAIEALLNCINILLGCGILTIPYALKEGGWAAFVVLAIMGASTNYTGKMLIKCQEYYANHPDTSPPPGSTIQVKGGVMQTYDGCTLIVLNFKHAPRAVAYVQCLRIDAGMRT